MRRMGVFAVATIAAIVPAWAVQAPAPVVLRARGEVSKLVVIGQPLPAGRNLTLRLGDALMLLDGKGVRTLIGPGKLVRGIYTRTGSAADARRGVQGRPRVASVRNAGAAPWLVSVASAGAICLPAERPLLLYRPGGAAMALDVQNAAGERRTLTFAGSASTVAWPSDLPTAAGSRYQLSAAMLGTLRQVEFREIDMNDPACAEQIDLNLRMAAPD